MERIADYEIEPLFLRRWSPRAMDGRPVGETELMRLFEAARWAPSSGNSQPWRFVFARRDTPHFQRFFDLLAEGNKPWCARAGALVIVVSKRVSEKGAPLRTHSFDTGAAWMCLALEGSILGLTVHGMAGFDYERARAAVEASEEYDVEAMIAIGHPGKLEDLPEPYRSRESPNGRRSVRESAFEGTLLH